MPEKLRTQLSYRKILSEPLSKIEMLEQLKEIELEAGFDGSDSASSVDSFSLGLVDEIIKLFLDTTPNMMAEMMEMESLGEYQRLSEIAHKLKSSSGSLGLIRFSRLCQFVEDRAGSAEQRDYRTVLLDLKRCFEESSIEILRWQMSIEGREKFGSDREAI